jgi:3-dehydro-L-gulonate 2-dehydrogenase
MKMLRVTYRELYDVLLRALLKTGLEPERAGLCAQLFADSNRDGVYSHGLNRFPRFIEMIRRGLVDIHARPARIITRGALERWDGVRGLGNLNAHHCMQRAIELSLEYGLGCSAAPLARPSKRARKRFMVHWSRSQTIEFRHPFNA